MTKKMLYRGILHGHNGWVTQIAANPMNSDMILSSSRDKSLIVWDFTRGEPDFGIPKKQLFGHSHFISDVVLSSDGNYALSGSWDKTLRLWDLAAGRSIRRFNGHTKDVLSVAFSADNRQIVSGSRDKTIKLWNTLAECKYTLEDDAHNDWVSSVDISSNTQNPTIVSSGWDKVVKVWNMTNCRIKANHYGHTGYLNSVTVSPDSSLCASGGKDCKAILWDLNADQQLHILDHSDIIEALCFNPNNYWLCVAFGSFINIWDLETTKMVEQLSPEVIYDPRTGCREPPRCLSLAWSTDGQTLFAGYTDNNIRVWQVSATDC